MRYISLSLAKEGDVVALPILDEQERILVNKNVTLNDKIIQRLSELGVSGISIEDEISADIDTYDGISQRVKPATIKHLRNFNLDKAIEAAEAIVEELLKYPEVYEYFNEKTFDNYTYEHSIGVSTYASMLGIACGYNKDELKRLAIAGMLHDIGKKCIDYEILHKPGKLTKEEYEKIQEHPAFGYNMVRDNIDIPATVKVVILEHHENEDGSGYPRKLTSDEIYKFSKIVHIADVYDALISKRPYKEAMPPKEAMDFIIEKTGSMFDEYFSDVFVQIMPSYPRGSLVVLNDNRRAIVLKNIRGNIHNPIVRIIGTNEVIKLYEDDELEIAYRLEE